MRLDRKIIIIILIIFVIVFGMVLIFKVLNKGNKAKGKDISNSLVDIDGNKIESASIQFNSIRDSVEYNKSKYIVTNKSSKEGFVADIYVEFYRELKPDNESYFNNFIRSMAIQIDYNNFRIIDEKSNIIIDVYCSNKTVEKIVINNEENYFTKLKTKQNLSDYKELPVTKATIQAQELNSIIEDEWKVNIALFNTNEGEYFNYTSNISMRVINGKVFNMVFKSLYKQEVVNGLTPKDTYDDMILKLGEPTISSYTSPIYGYKTKDFYIFFTKDEISIYRIETDNKTLLEAIKTLDKEGNLDNFYKKLSNTYKDYNENIQQDGKYELTYVLRGITVQNTYIYKPNITIYSNFEGIKELNNITIPSNIEINTEDNLILNAEEERYFSIVGDA